VSTFFAPRTWEELFRIPNLSDSAIPRHQMANGKIVGDYEMDPKSGLRPCGIAQCHTAHRHGYIVELDSEIRSYVGRDCGKSQFGVNWQQMHKTFRLEKQRLSRDRAIREVRSSLLTEIDNWRSLENDETSWAREMLKAFDEMPDAIRKTIESRANSADTAIFELRKETPEEVRRRAFRESYDSRRLPPPKLITVPLGKLRGLAGLRPSTRVDRILDVKVPNLLREARALVLSDASTADELGAMSKELLGIEGRINRAIDQLHKFVDHHNLDLLPHIRALQQYGVHSIRHEVTEGAHKFIIGPR